MDQHILLADRGEDVRPVGEVRGHLRLEGRLLEVAEPFDLAERRQ